MMNLAGKLLVGEIMVDRGKNSHLGIQDTDMTQLARFILHRQGNISQNMDDL